MPVCFSSMKSISEIPRRNVLAEFFQSPPEIFPALLQVPSHHMPGVTERAVLSSRVFGTDAQMTLFEQYSGGPGFSCIQRGQLVQWICGHN